MLADAHRVPPDWRRLGLTGNPFVNVAPGTHLDWVAWPQELERAIAQRPFRFELIGDKGAGKSTLLRAVAARLEADGLTVRHLHLAPGDRLEVPVLESGEVMLLDEADRATSASLRALETSCREVGASLGLGTHEPRAEGLFDRFVSLRLDPSPSLEWVRRRVEAHRAGTGGPDFMALAGELAPRVGGVNYRVLRTLYELAEDLARGETLTTALIDRAISRAR
jgi:hypothetical protein